MSSRGKGSRRKRTGTKQNANAFVENNQLDNQASTESVNTEASQVQEEEQSSIQQVEEAEMPMQEEMRDTEESKEEVNKAEDAKEEGAGVPAEEEHPSTDETKEKEPSDQNDVLEENTTVKPVSPDPDATKPEADEVKKPAPQETDNKPAKPKEKDIEIPPLMAFGSMHAKPLNNGNKEEVSSNVTMPQKTPQESQSPGKANAQAAPSPKDKPNEKKPQKTPQESPSTGKANGQAAPSPKDKPNEKKPQKPLQESPSTGKANGQAAPSSKDKPNEKKPQKTSQESPSTGKSNAQAAPSSKDVSKKSSGSKKPMTKSERKIERRRQRDEDFDRMAAIPRSNLVSTMFLPAATMKHVSRTKEPNLSQFTCFFANAIKWCAVGAVPAMWLGILINQDAFGTIRLNFTQQTIIDLFVIGFGMAIEYFSYYMLWFYSLLTRRPVSLRKLISVEARSSLSVALIMVVACLFSVFSVELSLTAGMVGIFVGVMLKAYGLDIVLKISKTEQILIVMVMIVVATMMALTFFPMVNGDVADILLRLFEI